MLTATAFLAPSPAFAADAPTFDKIPVANGFNTDDPVVLTGTAEPGDTVTLYEDAYNWASGFTQAELATHPAPDYNNGSGGTYPAVTTTANSSGRWTIRRPMDSGHIMMVGTNDGYSNMRYAAVRVQTVFSATANGANSVSLQVSVNPGQPNLPVVFQRYTSTGWVAVDAGTTTGTGDVGYGNTVSGQPAGTPWYRAYVGKDNQFADETNLIIANYSASLQVTVTGTAGGATPAPSGGNPTPNPAIADPGSQPNPNPTPTPSPTKPGNPTPNPSNPGTPAAGSVQFSRIQYNAPGTDSTKNSSIVGEYFRLTNKTKKAVNLNGWTVRDRAGNLYRFGSYSLAAGRSVLVRTGKGTNTSTTRFWGKTKHVWNNGGDTATLRTNGNKTIDTCRWSTAGKGYTAC
ncbi:lamin tail domain-containing protein [Actinoplanes sp. NPDC051861]|uniref:lamin tail domain-containing protein n=1 Tax=Actinoplanes sp. NPDC051861 TaxID=3155170 RepID=UPI00342A7939